ncbi:membrane-associated peptidase [Ketogulonicigenium robustum]|uniref:Membrane-associated peptidase n=1 Tax=Ketogulonicigenium robustum TaxID=92947 RepID=A0A1W6NYD0_9RHOB|nr:peptidase M50 [Ketogulonicigenium robustum]ARO14242.1 membrane-associated peptidase [Ketogulonicigenium robustum]
MINPFTFYSQSPQTIAYAVLVGVVTVTLHSWILAALTWLAGDRGPRQDGRLTLSPTRAASPISLLSITFTQIGWIRPMQITPRALRGGAVSLLPLLLISLALLALFAQSLMHLRPLIAHTFPGAMPAYVTMALIDAFRRTVFWYVAFNLLPIPPFLMGHLWLWRGQPIWMKSAPIGRCIALIAFVTLVTVTVSYRANLIQIELALLR